MIRKIVFLSLFVPLVSWSQLDSYVYGGGDDDFGTSFTFNELGGYVLLSTERPHIDSSNQIHIRSIDLKGNVIWKKTLGLVRHDHGSSIIRTSDGGYAVAGSIWEGGYGRIDACVYKLNNLGEVEWQQYVGGIQDDAGFSIKESKLGGFILVGYTNSDMAGSFGQMYVVRTNPNGQLLWEKAIGGPGKDYAFDVVENEANEIVVTGVYAGFHDYSAFEFTETNSDVLVYKLDQNGNEIWSQQIGGVQNELCYQIIDAPNGGYYLFGSTQSMGNGSFDSYLVKMDENGVVEWEETYGGSDVDYGRSASVSNNQYLYLVGSTANDPNSNKTDATVRKVNLDGSEVWSFTFGGVESEYANCVRATPDGGCAVIGSTKSLGSGGEDVFFMKLNADGEVEELTGNSEPFLLLYPNPSNDQITVYYQESELCFDYTYEVFNTLGEKVDAISTGSKVVQFDLHNLAAGTYHLRVTSTCASTITRKFIVLQ